MTNNELCHYGVKGMKWGVRLSEYAKARTIKRINTMYNQSNRWTRRKIKRLDAKSQAAKAKADVMREMERSNNKHRSEKINAITKMNGSQYATQIKKDLMDTMFGGQNFKDRNSSMFTNPISSLNEYRTQRSIRWTSNFTRGKTLQDMNPKLGYEYLNRKALAKKYKRKG